MIRNMGVAGVSILTQVRHLCLLLIGGFLLVTASPASAQICAAPGKDGSPGTITGVVNTYFPGTASVAASATSITLGPATGFSKIITANDLLIVIQMQDASIDVRNDDHYGDGVNNGPGSGYTNANGVGRYEFVKATNGVLTSGGTLTLQGGGTGGGLINAYTNAAADTTQGQRRFQVVRVPQYLSVTLSSGLTALTWNGSTGGILALDVAGSMSLNNSIVSVAGLGFRGGAGLRLQGPGGDDGDYRATAPTSATSLTGFHGSKGEGIAGTPRYVWIAATSTIVDSGVEGYPNGSMARGAPGNAGGGSTDGDPDTNAENSGGGGGGNGGTGGMGGNTWDSNDASGGFGGVSFAERLASRVVMGGGGGAGTRNNDTTIASSSGAAGGGIVIIRAGTVTGTGLINANGAAAYNDTNNDGGGGGGGGGSVVILAVSGNLSGLTVNANGGRGGDAWRTEDPNGNPGERHGPGGGGAGGVIFLSSAAASLSVTGGANGITSTANSAFGATAGAAGVTSTSMTSSQILGVQPGASCPVLPTAVNLVSFDASRSDDGVVLEWRTGYEVNNVGFNIYRQESDGKLVRLTPKIVAGSALLVRTGTPVTAGLSYSWADDSVKSGDSASYWLEDLDLNGKSEWHGPFPIDEFRRPTRIPASGKKRSMMIDALNAHQQEQLGHIEAAGPFETKAKLFKASGNLTITGLTSQTDLAGKPAVKISVRQEGWYRVTQANLIAAGLSTSVDPRKLQLFVDGLEIPMIVQGEQDGTFGPTDSIEFYGTGLDTSSTDTRVYWLASGPQPGLRFSKSNKSGSGSGSFPYTLQLKERLFYFSNVKNGETDNFFGAFIFNQPTDKALTVTHIVPGANATLEVSMQGFTQVPHQIGVSLNGSIIGTLNFANQAHQSFTLSVPQGLLVEGANTVSLVAQASSDDFSFVDYIRLTYSHSYTADNNALRFTASGGQGITIGGFTDSNIRVLDVTDSKSYHEVLGSVNPDNQTFSINISAPDKGTRTLLAFTDARVKQAVSVIANRPSALRTTGNSADFVMITPADFASSLDPLKSLRQSQGLRTQIVDVADVYDEFSFGQKSTQALKDFLAYTRSSWKNAPKYLLLAGTASFDPRNYFALGETDFVPSKFLETDRIETVSDDWFGDFNADGIPEIAVGRLPARSPQELETMVHKIIAFDQGAKGDGVLLVSDINDDSFNFESSNDQLRALIPAGIPVQEIRRGSDPAAKDHLIEALSLGKKIVNYTGHGSIDLWRANLLTTADAAALTNSQKLSIVVAMTCLNAYFVDERFESLAHALMSAREGGAVAMWSSSGLTFPGVQAIADQELFRQLFNGTSARLGDATIRAKAAVTDLDVRKTWILIGDPTTRLQ